MINNCHISVVIPLLNEEKNLKQLYSELSPVIKQITDNYEIIFVDDGSRDNSFEIIKQLNNADRNVTGISLSRNFGHQVALMAGLENSQGEVVITMDADLQHPPETIKELYNIYTQGYDIVNTRRIDSRDTGFFKKITSKCFYKLINYLSDVRIESASADFRLMNRKTVDAFINIREKDRFTRGLVSWMGFKQAVVEYKAPARFAGHSKYSFRKMLRFSLDGITSFSSKPLRLSFYTGIVLFLIGVIYAVFAIIQNFSGKTVQGWTSILVSVLIIGGFQLLALGIIGEYIARIFNEAKSRPIYFIKDKTS